MVASMLFRQGHKQLCWFLNYYYLCIWGFTYSISAAEVIENRTTNISKALLIIAAIPLFISSLLSCFWKYLSVAESESYTFIFHSNFMPSKAVNLLCISVCITKHSFLLDGKKKYKLGLCFCVSETGRKNLSNVLKNKIILTILY